MTSLLLEQPGQLLLLREGRLDVVADGNLEEEPLAVGRRGATARRWPRVSERCLNSAWGALDFSWAPSASMPTA